MRSLICLTLSIVVVSAPAAGRAQGQQQPAAWFAKQEPVRLFGNVYYVGTRGLSAILVTSSEGHVLIDGTMFSTTPAVLANVRGLGFKAEEDQPR